MIVLGCSFSKEESEEGSFESFVFRSREAQGEDVRTEAGTIGEWWEARGAQVE
jgi:hypothetical protein